MSEQTLVDKSRTGTASRFQAFNPATGEVIPRWYDVTTAKRLDDIVVAASRAFREYRAISAQQRAAFLDTIGDEILALGDPLVRTCTEETGLPEARIIGERARTVNQLKLFAELIREGSWVQARIDRADRSRQPAPKPDVRQLQRPIGPVGVFEASNFPLAFSTAGGDVASALAAGCTVVVKSHSCHPGTSELVASAIHRAIEKTGMPLGTFALVHGPGTETGVALVNHPLIKAIGFTGSFSGGKALFDRAVQRPEPIPVYAEMGSVNPVFVLPAALRTRGEEIATALANSIILGTGQFCTNPGLIITEDSVDALMFRNKLAEAMAGASGNTMLSKNIQQSFVRRVEEVLSVPGAEKLAVGKDAGLPCQGTPYIIRTSFKTFRQHETLSEEIFGPASVLVIADSRVEMLEFAETLKGHLTATLHAEPEDFTLYPDLIEILEGKVGRLIVNGVPTGVEVCHAMVHGGPFPATTDPRTTSVGTAAIYRFTRPVCYQDFPQRAMPAELRDDNPLSILRIVDGKPTRDKLLAIL